MFLLVRTIDSNNFALSVRKLDEECIRAFVTYAKIGMKRLDGFVEVIYFLIVCG